MSTSLEQVLCIIVECECGSLALIMEKANKPTRNTYARYMIFKFLLRSVSIFVIHDQVKTGVLMGRDSVAEVDDVFGNLQSLASNIDSLAKDISDQCADTTTTLGMNSVQSQAQNIKIQAAEVDGDVSSMLCGWI